MKKKKNIIYLPHTDLLRLIIINLKRWKIKSSKKERYVSSEERNVMYVRGVTEGN